MLIIHYHISLYPSSFLKIFITSNANNGKTNIESNANELLETVINLQKRLEFMILSTPTGIERDVMTEENIKALELIYKCKK